MNVFITCDVSLALVSWASIHQNLAFDSLSHSEYAAIWEWCSPTILHFHFTAQLSEIYLYIYSVEE